jgi:uncharacterized Zn-binding protein involved in type VI secretion
MPVTVNINGLSAVHQGSNGVAMATIPDVCKTPSAGGPIPIPYPNVAMSSDLMGGTSTVTIDGCSAAIQGSKFIKSTGDEAGVAGGVASNVNMMEATFLSFSPTVTLDGKPACRLTDKMLMNKGNTVCMGGELQGPVPPSAPDCTPDNPCETLSTDAPKRCVLRDVIVQCGHSKRNLQIDLAKNDVHVLQVISKAHEPDKVIVEWDGECGDSHSYCPTVGVQHKDTWKVIDKATATVELPAPSWILVRDWAWIFKVLATQKDMTYDYHTIQSRLCMGHARADVPAGHWLQIQVFPEAEWKAKFSIGYQHGKFKDASGQEDPFRYDPESTWKIEFSGEATYGANTFKCSLSAKQLADGLPLFGSLLEKVGWCAKVFDCMASLGADVKLTPRWPQWTFGGGLKLIELPGKPLVGTEGSFKFGFQPLFGLELQVSILDWLIRFAGSLAGPPGAILGQMLVQVRKRFAKGLGNAKSTVQASLDIDIVLTVGGDIQGGLGVKFVAGKGDIDPEAKTIDGGVDVKVEGRVIGKGRIWKFEVSGGGKVGVAGADGKEPSRFGASLTPKGGKDPFAMKGRVYSTGMAFYYLLYLEVGAAGAESKKSQRDPNEFGCRPRATNKILEKSGTCVLMQPWSWPKSS